MTATTGRLRRTPPVPPPDLPPAPAAVDVPPYVTEIRAEAVWQEEQRAHEARLRPVLDPYLARRSRGQADPVMDFLFEYYAFRPAQLLRWSPGLGVALAGPAAEAFLDRTGFVRTPAGVTLDPSSFPRRRLDAVRWTRRLLAGTAARPPFLGCSGLHEWAMVYRTTAVRHPQVPLRLPPDAIAAVVEAGPVVCSHFDAFRFFTPAARPLNRHQPTRSAMPDFEQPGCLHTNMDLYRWAFKLAPYVPGDLLADTFLLACRIREVDMRASPYDLRDHGLSPIPVETPEGRRHYRACQQRFAAEAAPLRARLIAAYDRLIAALDAPGTP